MLHWHSSHTSSKPKLPEKTESIVFYTLLSVLLIFLIVSWI